jgi:hypothetical protein
LDERHRERYDGAAAVANREGVGPGELE